MIVKCEQCQTRFKIPDEKVTDKGVKVRCNKCGHTFRVTRDMAQPATATPQPRVRWYFQLEPHGGGVRLRHGMQLGDAPSGLHVAVARYPEHAEKIVERRLAALRAGIQDTLRGVKELAEAPR